MKRPAATVGQSIKNTGTSDDPWLVCTCGNTPQDDGFVACDAQGNRQADEGNSPTDDWDGLHLLCRCGAVVRQADLTVVAVVVAPVPGLTVMLQAVPNRDFGSESHKGSVRLPPVQVACRSLAEAVRFVLAYIQRHDLGGGNLPTACGVVREDGKPVYRVSYNGRVWKLDEAGKETSEEVQVPVDEPTAEPAKQPPRHLGVIIKDLRLAAGLSRVALQDQTGTSSATITNAESGRNRPTAWTLRRLLRSPAMAELPERAAQAGFPMNVGAEQPEQVLDPSAFAKEPAYANDQDVGTGQGEEDGNDPREDDGKTGEDGGNNGGNDGSGKGGGT